MVESGTVLADRYRLDRRLGVGGMGEVWQARDLKFERDLGLRRDVAIKLMHSTLTESDMLKRFQLEAKILSKLNHPHIVRMLDADWQDAAVRLSSWRDGHGGSGWTGWQDLPALGAL